MLQWFDQHPEGYWAVVCVTLAIVVGIVVRGMLRSAKDPSETKSDWRWGFAMLAMLWVGRWPTLYVTREYNPDESFLIPGAMSLRHDFVFWRSVDGMTSGPLNFYALLPTGWLAGGDSYFSARLTALLLLAGALLFVHQIIAAYFGPTVARIATLPALCFEALTLNPEFLHYSTELLPVFLLTAAFYLSAVPPSFLLRSGWRSFAIGLLLGAVPFAKLQAAPIAFVGGLIVMAREILQARAGVPNSSARCFALVAGALVPALFFFSMLTATGYLGGAIDSYFRRNMDYIEAGRSNLLELFGVMSDGLDVPGTLFNPWFAGTLLMILAAFPWLKPLERRTQGLLAASILFVLLSAACVITPRRPFPHYLQFLVVPMTLTWGTSLGLLIQRIQRHAALGRVVVLTSAVALPLLSIVYARAPLPHPELGRLVLYQQHRAGTLAKAILNYADRGEAMGFWGWTGRYHVETGLRPATPHATFEVEIVRSPYSDYYRERYIEAFSEHPPPVFVDASHVPHLGTEQVGAHDICFPELAALVRAQYGLAETVDHARIFVRRDRLAERIARLPRS